MAGLLYTETDIKVIRTVSRNRDEFLVGTTPKNIPLNVEPEDYAAECAADFLRERGWKRVTIIHTEYVGAGHFNVLLRGSVQ